MELIKKISFVLTIIGGLNWGLIGLLGVDFLSMMFGPMTILTRLCYVLVGLSSLYLIFDHSCEGPRSCQNPYLTDTSEKALDIQRLFNIPGG